MNIPVVVERLNGSEFCARSGEPLPLRAEGSSFEEAVKNLKQLLEARLKSGACLTSIAINTDNPWTKLSGVFENDRYFDEWQAAIEEYRCKVDEDPDRI